MSTAEAAWGAYLIAASNMIRAIKAVSSERGRDPREYALVAFGGNGPLFAVAMAQALQIRQVLIPPSAGVFSSYGLLYSEVAYHFTRSRKALLGAVDSAEIDAILRELETHARTALTEDGFTQEQIALERAAALHYQGQSFELEVPVPPGAIDRATLAALEEAYGVEHEKTYGHRAGADEPVELITLKVVGRGVPEIPRAALAATARLPEDVVIAQPLRHAYFGPAPRLVRHCYHQPLRSPGAQGRTLHHRGIRFDLRRAARLDREPRPVREYRYRCACDPALNLALIPKIKRERPKVRIHLPPTASQVRT
jgi:N-methylhydantoinase A